MTFSPSLFRCLFVVAALGSRVLAEAPPQLPAEHLLFNGWGITPAGQHVPVSGDMPLKMIVAPDGKIAVAVCAGYNSPGLAVIDLAQRKLAKFFPLPHAWGGVTFDKDGKRLFVAGGGGGDVHVFNYERGELVPAPSVKIEKDDLPVFVTGLALHPTTGRLYVCNEANHEVWVLNAQTLAVEQTIAAGEHPHSCVFGADKKHL
ncbi:MAG TPA: YncE family protein, partial [Chthoniobacteraceae bacterium]|nr:YncE family protein [Chthoniobacteraceae bacterium]